MGNSSNKITNLGYKSGEIKQGKYAIAIGSHAGSIEQGTYSIAIGNNAGYYKQAESSIILNATKYPLTSVNEGFFVNPISLNQYKNENILSYNPKTHEIICNKSGISLPLDTTIGSDTPIIKIIGEMETQIRSLKENIIYKDQIIKVLKDEIKIIKDMLINDIKIKDIEIKDLKDEIIKIEKDNKQIFNLWNTVLYNRHIVNDMLS